MRRSTLRGVLTLGLLLGGAYVVWRVLESDRRVLELDPSPEPRRTRPDRATAPADAGAVEAAWVEPDDRTCPASHPVKAKLSSGIYHEPSGASYERTAPDRCYRDGSAAQRDGLRPAKR
jgi:hypothetical protein